MERVYSFGTRQEQKGLLTQAGVKKALLLTDHQASGASISSPAVTGSPHMRLAFAMA